VAEVAEELDRQGVGERSTPVDAGPLRGRSWWPPIAAHPLPYVVGLVVLVVGYGPLLFLGPGTDLDTAGIYQSGQAILSGHYVASRRPGAPVYELVAGLLHAVGGTFLVNLGGLVMAAALAFAVVSLLRQEDHPHAEWLGVAVLVNPFVWIAGTSMVEHIFAIGFLMIGACMQQRRRWVWAGLFFALACGCRLPFAVLVAMLLLADLARSDPALRRKLAVVSAGTAAAIFVLFIPSLLTLHSQILEVGVPDPSLPVQIGRFLVKNFYFFGPAMLILVVAVVPRLVRGIRAGWSDCLGLRMGLLLFLGTELLFLKFPWKLAHLIPAWVALVVVLGASRALSARLVALVLACQALLVVVDVNPAQPDVANAATGGHLAVQVVQGPLVREIQCRLDSDRTSYRAPDGIEAVLAAWNCASPWYRPGDSP
jgi:hypothetical protein